MSKPLLLLLALLVLTAHLPHRASAIRGNLESEILTEWVSTFRWMEPGVSLFELSHGDSLDLNCRRMRHMLKIPVQLELEWLLMDRPVKDEGPTGRVHLMENNGRLTMENVDSRDSGLYAAYTRSRSLAWLLDITQLGNNQSSSGSIEEERRAEGATRAVGDRVAACLFIVRVSTLRNYTLREGERFTINTTNWLIPLADSLTALNMKQAEWSLAWHREGDEPIVCRFIATCQLNFTATRGLTIGVWRLELRSLTDKRDQRRVLLEIVVSVLPSLTYLEAFPLATHKYYMVYGSLTVALFLLSLHLFNNLNWTPFAFDILPDQVSPKAVLDQAGVFLKETQA